MPAKKSKVKETKTAAPAAKQDLLTLTDVAKKVKISLPSAQRYKKLYQDRIPSVGEGRKQRYPQEAVAVFRKIKAENTKRRGRPRKKVAADLITLTEISRRTGISYPTCVSYVKKYPNRIPHVGKGRKRRFPEEAVPVFREIRSQSRRGRKPGTAASTPARKRAAGADKALLARIKSLEKAQAENTRLLKVIAKQLQRPLQIVVKRG